MGTTDILGFLAGDDVYAGQTYKRFTEIFRKAGGLAYLNLRQKGAFLDSNMIHLIKAYQGSGLMRSNEGLTARDFLPDPDTAGPSSSLVWSAVARRFDAWAGMNLDLTVGDLSSGEKADLALCIPLLEYWLSRSFEGLYGAGLTWLPNNHLLAQNLGAAVRGESESIGGLNYTTWVSDESHSMVLASGLPLSSREGLRTALVSAFNTFASSGTASGILAGTALGTIATNWRTNGTPLGEAQPGVGLTSFATMLGHDYGCNYPEVTASHVSALLWAMCHAATSQPLKLIGHYLTALSRFIGNLSPRELPVNMWDWLPANRNGVLVEPGDMLPDPYFAGFLRLLKMYTFKDEYTLNETTTSDLKHPYIEDIIDAAASISSGMRPQVKELIELMLGDCVFRTSAGAIVGDPQALAPYESVWTTYGLTSQIGKTWTQRSTTMNLTPEGLDAVKGAYAVDVGTYLIGHLKSAFYDLIEADLLLTDNTPLDEETLITMEKQAENPQILEALARILEVSVEELQAVLKGESSKVPARAVRTLLLQGLPETAFSPEEHDHPEYVRIDTPVDNVERLVELDDEGRPVRYYTANDFAPADHKHDDEYYLLEEKVNNTESLLDMDEVEYTKDSFARVGHEHPQYLRIGESAYAARAFFDGLNEYGPDYFADIDHEHYDDLGNLKYLRVGEPALAALRVGGKTWRDFALKNHRHDDLYYTRDEYDQLFVKRVNIPEIAPAIRAINGLKMFFGNTSIGAGDSIVIKCSKPVACAVTLIGASTHSSKPRVLLNDDGVHIAEATGTADCVFTYLIFYTGEDENG